MKADNIQTHTSRFTESIKAMDTLPGLPEPTAAS